MNKLNKKKNNNEEPSTNDVKMRCKLELEVVREFNVENARDVISGRPLLSEGLWVELRPDVVVPGSSLNFTENNFELVFDSLKMYKFNDTHWHMSTVV